MVYFFFCATCNVECIRGTGEEKKGLKLAENFVYDKDLVFAFLIFDLVLFITSRRHYVRTFTVYANFKVYSISAFTVKMTVVSDLSLSLNSLQVLI